MSQILLKYIFSPWNPESILPYLICMHFYYSFESSQSFTPKSMLNVYINMALFEIIVQYQGCNIETVLGHKNFKNFIWLKFLKFMGPFFDITSSILYYYFNQRHLVADIRQTNSFLLDILSTLSGVNLGELFGFLWKTFLLVFHLRLSKLLDLFLGEKYKLEQSIEGYNYYK